MINRELYFRDPGTVELLNNGVSKVSEVGADASQLRTLKFELETFVCNGEYAKGLERILNAYLQGLGKTEQQAVWVSGFFGSGKSHLVKMLRYLWEDYRFPDGTAARSLVRLPDEVSALLTELTTRSKAIGGLRAAAGTLGAGSMDNVRLAFVQLVLRSAGLPEDMAKTRLLLWLRSAQLEAPVADALQKQNLDLREEVESMHYSVALAEAILAAQSKYGSVENVQAMIRDGYPEVASPTIQQSLDLIKQIYGKGGKLPCTLLVIDEIQQFIGERVSRANDIQEITEHCCTDLGSRLLIVGTGQSALTTTPSLARLQARFFVRVQLSDTDVEGVIRQTVLMKKPQSDPILNNCFDVNQGELSRHLQGSRMAATNDDAKYFAADYPLIPTRRRFWEKVLRNTDSSGTKAQLRSQLQIVFEATQNTAELPLGAVVPADFIYDQIATDLINSGQLQPEYDQIIRQQRDGTEEGALRSSLCALIFLIGKLPTTEGFDEGVRATAETLIDLLVSDLKADRPRLEQSVRPLLQKLVDAGQIMAVDHEFRLQTKEGSQWTHDYNKRRASALNDEARINARRTEWLREGVKQALKGVVVKQGVSGEARKHEVSYSSVKPNTSGDSVTVWMRDGWNDDDSAVLNDARAAGVNSALLFGFLPRQSHEPLRQAIASHIAAREALDTHGAPSPTEGIAVIEARKAVETHLEVAKRKIDESINQVLVNAKILLGGGAEVGGTKLADKVMDASQSAVVRLFDKFADADHPNWGQVVNRARSGDVGALSQVGFAAEAKSHPVCKRVLAHVGPGKKGKEIRDHFKAIPYGWPQDAIDGALYLMLLAGDLRATINNQPVQATAIPQNQVGVANFYVDTPPLNVSQRLELKALFSKLSVMTQSGKEAEAAAQFLPKLIDLADSAGGEAPRPERGSTQSIRDLQSFSGNAQLLKIHEGRDQLAANLEAWKKSSELIAKRQPAWQRLLELDGFAKDLPAAGSYAASIAAINENRSLLADPDPVPGLIQQLTGALRVALDNVQQRLTAAFTKGDERLSASPEWNKLSAQQRMDLSNREQLTTPAPDATSTGDEILQALRIRGLADRRNLIDAIPQRFDRALAAATRLLEPTVQHVVLPGATLRTTADLDHWLAEVRNRVEERLKDGPVIV